MGHFSYGQPGRRFDLDDRTLAHLQLVVIAKFRRGESFLFQWEIPSAKGGGRIGLWLCPSIPIVFSFEDETKSVINRRWLEKLMDSAHSVNGLVLVDEPLL